MIEVCVIVIINTFQQAVVSWEQSWEATIEWMKSRGKNMDLRKWEGKRSCLSLPKTVQSAVVTTSSARSWLAENCWTKVHQLCLWQIWRNSRNSRQRIFFHGGETVSAVFLPSCTIKNTCTAIMSKRIVYKNFCVRTPNGDAVIMKRKTANYGNLEWKLCLKADMETVKQHSACHLCFRCTGKIKNMVKIFFCFLRSEM